MRQVKDKVLFRMDAQGEFAIFPEIPADYDGDLCAVFRNGEMQCGDCRALLRQSTASDGASLLAKLRALGYKPWPVVRESPTMRAVRRAIADFLKGV